MSMLLDTIADPGPLEDLQAGIMDPSYLII